MRTVVAFGTFDIIHPGHISYLEYARSLGDRLIVIVTPDSAVMRRKGQRALFDEKERMLLVAALRSVDRVILGDRDDSWNAVVGLPVDIVCFGYDQEPALCAFKMDALRRFKKRPRLVSAPAARPRRYHSKKLKLRIY